MKLNELTKNELIDLLNIIFECGCNYSYIRISDIVFNYLLNRFNKQFDSLMSELDKIKITSFSDLAEYEILSQKLDKLDSKKEELLTIEELEQYKSKKDNGCM